MALSRTSVFAQTFNTNGAGETTGSFTPPANSLLVVSLNWESSNIAFASGSVTLSGGGLTWTSEVNYNASTTITLYPAQAIFVAPVGASPSSMTLTIGNTATLSSGDGLAMGVHVVAYTGYDTVTPVGVVAHRDVGSVANGATNAPFTLTLGSAPASTSVEFGSAFGGPNNSAGTMSPGSGCTEIYDFVGTDYNNISFESQEITGTTSTSFTWSSLDDGVNSLGGAQGFWACGLAAIEIRAASGGAPTFTLATTETPDAAAFTTTFADKFALAVTEAPDTASFTATLADRLALAVTETPDTASFTATFADQLSFSTTETPDTAAFTTTFADQFSLNTTETADVAAFNLGGIVSFALAVTEAPDTAAFTATFADQFTLAATEAPDVAAFAIDDPNALSLATTETPDIAAFTATLADQLSLTTTEGADVAAFTTTVSDQLALSATEAPDVAAFTTAFTGIPTFALSATEAPDVVAFVLGVVNPIVVNTGGGRPRISTWDDSKRTKRERLESERLERERDQRKTDFRKRIEDTIRPAVEAKPAAPAKPVKGKVEPAAPPRDTTELKIATENAVAAKAKVVIAEITAKSNIAEKNKKASVAERERAERAAIESRRRKQRAYDDALAVMLLTSL